MRLAIQENVSLKQYTTLKVGGVADYVAEVNDVAELRAALLFAEQTKVPPLILGGGSNVLINDAGYRGLVIRVGICGREYNDMSDTECLVRVGAGEVLDAVVAESVNRGLWGLENLSSIPGSVGGTPVQNVGAYGVEVSSLIKSVEAMNIHTREEKIFSNDECLFLYRNSFFKTDEGKQWVITAVTFSLSKVHNPKIQYADLVSLQEIHALTPTFVRETVQHIRSQKFPDWTTAGTAGSFFKNPIISAAHFADLKQQYPELPGHIQSDGSIKVSLGYVLDKVCGLRGHCEGGVCLYEKQALVLVTEGNVSAEEINSFSKKIVEKVFLKTKIEIESEVVRV